MIEPVINHLWQSTLFALAAGLLTLAFRRNGAHVRFLIWFAGSVKFLIPFSLFIWVGDYFRWDTLPDFLTDSGFSTWMGQIAQPAAIVTNDFADTATRSAAARWDGSAWTILLSIWFLGSLALLCFRFYQWLQLSVVVKASSPLDIDAAIPARETTSTLEPGIFGIVSPTLLMPAGIAGHLAPEHLQTILAHELCHWRRRDNLTAAIHMLVEVLFWFHPLVWWIGGKLVVERERACDEAVIQSGSDRQAYAEGILKVCQHYAESPLCAAGVSGGLLRKRIEDIMTNPILSRLPVAKRCLLSAAAIVTIAAPICLGLAGSAGVALAASSSSVEMRRYRNDEWKFELDIPKQWVVVPPVPNNGPEVVRFESKENGYHGLIVWRAANDPKVPAKAMRDEVQKVLAKGGFSNFVPGETRIGSRNVLTLDFNRTNPDGSVWSCRQYYIIDGALQYTLGFGTTGRDAMFDAYDRMAKSFVFEQV